MEHTEQFIGQLNIVPLLAELWLGSLGPGWGGKKTVSFQYRKRW
ncbi:hypothetical protein [Spongiimicrobium sp. 2-473A-2-J]